jgi:hypothetical protein
MAAILSASLLLLSGGSALSQYNDVNADNWTKSIQSDIINGAPREQICSNAFSSAKASGVAEFKDWAYGVVRRYCPEKLGEKKQVGSVSGDNNALPNCSLKLYQMNLASLGRRVEVVGEACWAVFN